jgi:XTP/dITP diphosphohydrolase
MKRSSAILTAFEVPSLRGSKYISIMDIYFVTTNKGKIANAQMALGSFGITVKQLEMELVESRSEDPKDIALEKARQAFAEAKQPVIVEDSGFFIEALGGFPMTHINFSLKTLGIKNILKMMEGRRNRKAEWRMTLAYVYGREKYETFTFIERGIIAHELRPLKRPMMSDYWRVYIPKMIPSNRLALCEMKDKALEAWQNYYKKNNHFMMFGRWFSKKS